MAAVFVTLGVGLASATSIVPPDFPTLVNRADHVVAAVVKEIDYRKEVRGENRLIFTLVTLEVNEVLAGPALQTSSLTLRLLGGRSGDEVLQVDAMPNFIPGQEVVVFVTGNGRNICPVVGWGHGKMLVRRDAAGSRRIYRANAKPLEHVGQVQEPLKVSAAQEVAAASSSALTYVDFARSIRAEKERQAR